jgi:multisubunit Na+/H+ antiporter MnhC subunit
MTVYKIIGLTLIALGIGMLILGASLFTYQGPPLNPIISDAGKYSFSLFLPTLFLGVVCFYLKGKKK